MVLPLFCYLPLQSRRFLFWRIACHYDLLFASNWESGSGFGFFYPWTRYLGGCAAVPLQALNLRLCPPLCYLFLFKFAWLLSVGLFLITSCCCRFGMARSSWFGSLVLESGCCYCFVSFVGAFPDLRPLFLWDSICVDSRHACPEF